MWASFRLWDTRPSQVTAVQNLTTRFSHWISPYGFLPHKAVYLAIGPSKIAASLALRFARSVHIAWAQSCLSPMHVKWQQIPLARGVGSWHALYGCIILGQSCEIWAWHAVYLGTCPCLHALPLSCMCPQMRADTCLGLWSTHAVCLDVWRFGHVDPSASKLVHCMYGILNT